MNVSDMISDLDDHGFADVSSTRKVAILQDTIWQIEGIKPWPFLVATWSLTFDGVNAAPSNWATLTPAFRATMRLRDMSNGRKLAPVRGEEADDRMGLQTAQGGDPQIYYFEGSNMKVWPIPPSGRTMNLRGTRWSDPISTSTLENQLLIPKYFHRGLIVNGALQRLYAMEDDTELAPVFQNYQSAAMDLATEVLFKQQYDRMDHVKVTDSDSWDYGDFVFGPFLQQNS
jgi:hypothetical protein